MLEDIALISELFVGVPLILAGILLLRTSSGRIGVALIALGGLMSLCGELYATLLMPNHFIPSDKTIDPTLVPRALSKVGLFVAAIGTIAYAIKLRK